MPLINLKTDLKSLKYSKDRPEGASSKEPFITKDIPGTDEDRKAGIVSDGGPDFMLRGGVLAPLRAFDDLKRTKDLFFQTPKGLLFTAKMNLLSRMAPKTIAAQGAGYAGGLINQGAYLPLGLAVQTGLSFIGSHTNTFGLNPFSPGQQRPSLAKQLGSGGLVQYDKAILGVAGDGNKILGGLVSPLANLYEDKIIVKSLDPNVVEYGGGPGAPLGIGKTKIRYSDISYGQNRTGDNNPYSVSNKEYFYTGIRPNSNTLSVDNLANIISNFGLAEAPTERKVTGKIDYSTVSGFGGTDNGYTYNISSDGGFTFENLDAINVYKRNDQGQPSLEPSNDTPTNTANPTSDFISPRTNATKYNDISGFGGASGNEGYDIDLSSDGGVTWENLDAQKAYQSGSLDYNNTLPAPNRPNGQTTEDFISPLSTDYSSIPGFGGDNGEYEDNINKEGGFTWDNVDARKIYNSGSLTPINNPTSSSPQTVNDFVNGQQISNPTLTTPEGPTTYAALLGGGNSLNPNVTSNGGLTFTDSDQNKTTIGAGDAALNFNSGVVEITSRYKNIQFTSTQDSSSNLTDFRGLPIPLLAPVSNGFNRLNNILGTMDIDFSINAGVGQGVYKNGITFGQTGSDAIETNVEFIKETGNGVATWVQGDFESLTDSDLYPQTQQIKDFRDDILELDLPADSTKKVLSRFNGDYNTKRIETRVNLGDPGARRNVQNYSVGGQEALDKINASGIYESSVATHTGDKLDLVKFSIGYIQNNDSGNSNFMNFRAYITSFSDAYTSEWGETQYAGRGDKFYNYKGFGRSISMGFKVYATSQAELIPMYKKLNFLASGLAPSYSSGGFMRGNLSRLTVGGYLYNQLGFIKGLTYTIPNESTWEIGIDNTGEIDSNVKELPHMIDVGSFTFQPIEEFIPRIGDPSALGRTPYIALKDGANSNY
tara:strand:- start:3629 stop:6436 length:2808 start_codon:yes stop_codon:yes gene_type:complete